MAFATRAAPPARQGDLPRPGTWLMKVAIGRRQQSGQGPMKTSSDYKSLLINRRKLLGYSAAVGVAAGFRGPLSAWAQESPLGVNADEWTPEYITSIAGTLEVDTAAECAKVVPLDYKGRLTYWWVGPNEASPQIDHEIDDAVLGGLREDLPEHHGREAESRLQRHARQAAHRGARQRRADGGEAADPLGRRVRRQGPAAGVRARGCRLLRPSEFWPAP